MPWLSPRNLNLRLCADPWGRIGMQNGRCYLYQSVTQGQNACCACVVMYAGLSSCSNNSSRRQWVYLSA